MPHLPPARAGPAAHLHALCCTLQATWLPHRLASAPPPTYPLPAARSQPALAPNLPWVLPWCAQSDLAGRAKRPERPPPSAALPAPAPVGHLGAARGPAAALSHPPSLAASSPRHAGGEDEAELDETEPPPLLEDGGDGAAAAAAAPQHIFCASSPLDVLAQHRSTIEVLTGRCRFDPCCCFQLPVAGCRAAAAGPAAARPDS